jgi:hypothetical protein
MIYYVEDLMIFNSKNPECYAYRCRKCCGKVCICTPDNEKWDAHCMGCNESIFWYGSPHPHLASSAYKAVAVWNWMNTQRFG